jgi:hypothetical protein
MEEIVLIFSSLSLPGVQLETGNKYLYNKYIGKRDAYESPQMET